MRGRRLWAVLAVMMLVIVSLACGTADPTEAPAAEEQATEAPAAEEAAPEEEEADEVEPTEVPATDVPPTDEPEVEVETITTVRGDMTVPGVGYMDGKDAQADPPLTVMNINIWDAAERTAPVCKLQHGTPVNILSAEWVEDEDRYYFEISGPGCDGWIQAPFLSPEYHESIGDEF